MPEVSEAVAAAFIILAAATVVGTVGFGLGITASPLLLLVFDPKTVVVFTNTVSTVIFVMIIVQDRRDIPLAKVAPLSVAGVLGAPLGVAVLTIASATALRVAIVTIILALAAAVAMNFRGSVPRPGLVGPPLAFSTSGMIAALGIGGPIMALFLLGQGVERRALRVSLAVYFLAMGVVAMGGYVVADLYTAERLWLLAIAAVPAVVGFRLASVVLRRMNEVVFRRGVIGVTVVSSLMVLGREILSV